MSNTEAEMAAAIVTATTFNATIIVASTTPDHKKRPRENKKSSPDTCMCDTGKAGDDDVVNYDDDYEPAPRHEKESRTYFNEKIVKSPLITEDSFVAAQYQRDPEPEEGVLKEEEKVEEEEGEASPVQLQQQKQEQQSGIEGIVAAVLVTATTAATAIMIASTCTISQVQEEEVSPTPLSPPEVEVEEELDNVSVISQSSVERALAASVVLSTTSATSIMLAAVNTSGGQSQSQSNLEGSTTLPSLQTEDQFWSDRPQSPSTSTHLVDVDHVDKHLLAEASRQSETTYNKFMAVDVISHKYAWLFHLIDRNSDASLTLTEFLVALADQPLVSMVWDNLSLWPPVTAYPTLSSVMKNILCIHVAWQYMYDSMLSVHHTAILTLTLYL